MSTRHFRGYSSAESLPGMTEGLDSTEALEQSEGGTAGLATVIENKGDYAELDPAHKLSTAELKARIEADTADLPKPPELPQVDAAVGAVQKTRVFSDEDKARAEELKRVIHGPFPVAPTTMLDGTPANSDVDHTRPLPEFPKAAQETSRLETPRQTGEKSMGPIRTWWNQWRSRKNTAKNTNTETRATQRIAKKTKPQEQSLLHISANEAKITLLNLDSKSDHAVPDLKSGTEFQPAVSIKSDVAESVEQPPVKYHANAPETNPLSTEVQAISVSSKPEDSTRIFAADYKPQLVYDSPTEGARLPLTKEEIIAEAREAHAHGMAELHRKDQEVYAVEKVQYNPERGNNPWRPDLWAGVGKERAHMRKFKELAMHLYEQGTLTLEGADYYLSPDMPPHELKKYREALAAVKKEFAKKHRKESRITQRLSADTLKSGERIETTPAIEIIKDPELTSGQKGALVSILAAALARWSKYKSASHFAKQRRWRR